MFIMSKDLPVTWPLHLAQPCSTLRPGIYTYDDPLTSYQHDGKELWRFNIAPHGHKLTIVVGPNGAANMMGTINHTNGHQRGAGLSGIEALILALAATRRYEIGTASFVEAVESAMDAVINNF